MANTNLRRVLLSNVYIADEDARYGTITPHNKPKGFVRKEASPETVARNAAERRYTRRSNICPDCHLARARGTGTCDCTD